MVETLDVKYVLSWARASTAKTRSRAASDLRTKPRAPAFKTSRTICSDSCRVRISTLASGFVFKICRVASSPFRLGIPMSRMITSGFSRCAFSTATRPSPRLAAYLPLRLGVQKRHQTLAYHFMVVGHEDSQCAHGLPPQVPGAWDSTAATLA